MKILAIVPNSGDGTSFYRGQSVLNELHKVDERVQVTYVDQFHFRFQDAKGFDVAFFQRPDTMQYILAMQAIKALGIPIVCDYDDYLLGVPAGNKYHRIMTNNDNPYEQAVEIALNISDHLIVSTNELKRQFSKYNKNITVIRNAFDDYCFKPCETLSSSKKVLWRGGATHQPDFDYYGDEIFKIIKSNPDFEFTFWTEIPSRPENSVLASISGLISKLSNVKVIPAVSPIDYFQGLQKLKPCLIVTVNKDNIFNRCKSDCAKLEGFYCGALTVHDDWEEWQWGVNQSDKKYFFERANEMLGIIRKKDEVAKEIYKNELQYVKDFRLLSSANIYRCIVFKKVLNCI